MGRVETVAVGSQRSRAGGAESLSPASSCRWSLHFTCESMTLDYLEP